MVMEITVLVLCLSLLVMSFLAVKQYGNNLHLREENELLKKEVTKSKTDKDYLVSIDPGDRAIIPNYSLVYAKGEKDEHHFEVTYEVEIVEVSLDKVKVKATGLTTHDSKINNEPSRRASCIAFMQDKWISRKSIELVVDDTMRRDAKLQQLL
jgi:hypothetical protein